WVIFGRPVMLRLTKFMILELLAAVLIAAVFIPVARRLRSGEPARGGLLNALEAVLTVVPGPIAPPSPRPPAAPPEPPLPVDVVPVHPGQRPARPCAVLPVAHGQHLRHPGPGPLCLRDHPRLGDPADGAQALPR